jgi:outer membrane phospholipase A
MEQSGRPMVNHNKIEQAEAKRMGARVHKNSGRGSIQKGDASWKNFCVDFKHVSKSFTINSEVWAKVTTDAIKNHKDPMILIVLGEGTQKVRLAIIELELLEQLIEGEQNDRG